MSSLPLGEARDEVNFDCGTQVEAGFENSRQRPKPKPTDSAVAEVQGLYGAFFFPERLLQKIWSRRQFTEAKAQTSDGRKITVVHPGKWNHLGGPDFTNARLRIGGVETVGDVELHLNAKDWKAHGHAADSAYDNVVLHVVLFPTADTWTAGGAGRQIPVLCLLPLLHHGLEEYSADEAMEQLAGRPLHHAQETLSVLGRQELDTLLREHSKARWMQKVHYAGERIKRLGWTDACHHAALEILGYRFNRATMLSIATEYPLAAWAEGRVDAENVFNQHRDRWSLQGVRPLNHPRRRLTQYAQWTRARPNWPDDLEVILCDLAQPPAASNSANGSALTTRDWRRDVGLPDFRNEVAKSACADFVSGTRLDNLVCDGFLPLLAAKAALTAAAKIEPEFTFGNTPDSAIAEIWHYWFAGDVPESVVNVLRALAVFDGRAQPVSQGPVQGLLGWLLAREAEAR